MSGAGYHPWPGVHADRFGILWAALVSKTHGQTAFAWEPHRFTLDQYAAQGCVLRVQSPIHAHEAPMVYPVDPTWSDPEVEEDGEGPCALFDIHPELRPHLPKDGKLRAVATFSAYGGETHEHEVCEIDPRTLTLGPPFRVLAFRASDAN